MLFSVAGVSDNVGDVNSTELIERKVSLTTVKPTLELTCKVINL